MSDEVDNHTQHDQSVHVWYCPRCGATISPRFSFAGDSSADVTAECPNHGEINIEYHEIE